MLFFPALACVQLWWVKEKMAEFERLKNANSTLPTEIREVRAECFQLGESCKRIQLFAGDRADVAGCEEVLEHGPLCL
jgi:hypothetical protein